jgi:hypothetical protein
VHPAGAERPGPQGAAVPVGGDGGLHRVLFLLARGEGPAAGLARRGAPDLHFGAVQAEGDAAGGGAGAQVGEGLQPDPGLAGDGEPAGGQQRADLVNRAGERGPVNPVQPGQRLARELEPQVNKGDDDPVGERQVVVRAGAGGALALVPAAAEQPVFLGCGPLRGQFPEQPGQVRTADPGPDTKGSSAAAGSRSISAGHTGAAATRPAHAGPTTAPASLPPPGEPRRLKGGDGM